MNQREGERNFLHACFLIELSALVALALNCFKNDRVMKLFNILEWDSAFFGIKVAEMLPTIKTEAELLQALDLARASGVKLVYWACPRRDTELHQAALVCQGCLVDKKITYLMQLDQFELPAKNSFERVEEYRGLVGRDLEDLAVEAGKYSRFKVDPQIPDEKYVALYKQWIANSVHGQMAQVVYVAKIEGKIVGMVTVGEHNGRGNIGLIAVHPGQRKKMLGQALLCAAHKWCREMRFPYAQVVTQEENTAACKLYEKCGYHRETVEYFYHFWIER